VRVTLRRLLVLLAAAGAALPGAVVDPTARAQDRPAARPAPVEGAPAIGARVRVIVPGLGPGWRTGMFNRTRQEPPCYLVLLFHPGSGRRIAVTMHVRAVTRLQLSTLYPGNGPADPDPAAAAHEGEDWREVALDDVRAAGRHCPSAIESER
jgi:hypothetical protein